MSLKRTEYWWIKYGGELTIGCINFNEQGYMEASNIIGEEHDINHAHLVKKIEVPSAQEVDDAVFWD